MNATKLTLIVLAAAAIMFGGCSTDNPILGPGTDLQSETGINSLNRIGSDSDSKFDNNESAPEQKRFTIVAKVLSVDVEGGCWYLEADDGNSYTPVSPKELVLESGLVLKAEGYIDKKIQFFCGNGPAFVIESYEIIGKPGSRHSESATESDFSKENSAFNDGGTEINTLKGIVNVSKDGCLILKTVEKKEFVLQHDTDVLLNKGDQILVTGYISTLPSFTCYNAPVFYAETVSVFSRSKGSEKSDRPLDESAPGTTGDDSDQYIVPSEDTPPVDDMMDRQEEEKKKREEEERLADLPKDEKPPSTLDDESDNDSFERPDEDRKPQDDLTDRQLEEKKIREAEEERGENKDNDRP